MNLILLREEDFVSSTRVRLAGRRVRHLRKVLRAELDDQLRVGLLGGDCGVGRLLALDRESAELEVVLDTAPPPASPHRLVLSLPRPPALRRILRAVTSMGVKRIALVGSARAERSFWQSSQVLPEKIREQLELGLEQARDTRLPDVCLAPRFSHFVAEQLPEWLRDSRGLVGHPDAAGTCPRGCSDPVSLIVGPEGGFVDAELELLAIAGVERISLGPRPLSVDTAAIALLARLTP